jgi:hypothetical protein
MASGGGWELAICTGNYAQFRDVLIMQTVKLDREVVKSIKINVNAIFSLV